MAYKALAGCSILFLSKLVLSLILILPVPRVPKTLRQLLSLAGQENRGAGAQEDKGLCSLNVPDSNSNLLFLTESQLYIIPLLSVISLCSVQPQERTQRKLTSLKPLEKVTRVSRHTIRIQCGIVGWKAEVLCGNFKVASMINTLGELPMRCVMIGLSHLQFLCRIIF